MSDGLIYVGSILPKTLPSKANGCIRSALMYLASVWCLGEAADRRSTVTLAFGLLGVLVIVWGGRHDAQLLVVHYTDTGVGGSPLESGLAGMSAVSRGGPVDGTFGSVSAGPIP